MNELLNSPIAVRLAVMFVLGACVGSALNAAIYGLWRYRPLNPWLRDPTPGDAAHGADYLPLFGWFSLRRREKRWGQGFWIRPLFVELLTATLFAALYWWEVYEKGLLTSSPISMRQLSDPRLAQAVLAQNWPAPGGLLISLHLTCFSHLVLVSLMIVATFIDFDDEVIPDTITVPGTLAGLTLAAVVPWSLLPEHWLLFPGGLNSIRFLTAASPELTADWQSTRFLWIGIACFWGWCLALMDWHWRRTRRGFRFALRIFVARLVGSLLTWLLVLLGAIGTGLIVLVWNIGGPHWIGLCTSLIGMAVCGGVMWALRIGATAAAGIEAVGFGDVTLLAMIGSFLGWQSVPLIIMGGACYGSVVGLGEFFLRKKRHIPYGPFLCLGTLTVIWLWPAAWQIVYEALVHVGIESLIYLLAVCSIVGILLLYFFRWTRWFRPDE